MANARHNTGQIILVALPLLLFVGAIYLIFMLAALIV
jgi:hypothetical protein